MKITLNSADDAQDFCKVCNSFKYDIDVYHGRYIIDAKSILGLASLGLPNTVEVVPHTQSDDETLAFYYKIRKWRDIDGTKN